MKLDVRTMALAAALLLSTGSAAHALIFAEKTPEQKLRADIGKQIFGYLKCLGQAAVACEKTGALPARECVVATGVATAPADPKAKFAAAIAKCDAKLDYGRKAPRGSTSLQSYELLGCPSYGSGLQFASLEQYKQILLTAKSVIDNFVGNMPFVAGCTDAKSCAADAKHLLGLIDSMARCKLACENDYKDRKGNGGPTDDLAQCEPTGDPNAQACLAKVTDKFLDKAADWPFGASVVQSVTQVADSLSDTLFNIQDQCD